jgi:hypothetical protein
MGRKVTREEFIERAKAVHGGRYDYSKLVYVNGKTKVTIICSIHGEFRQTPSHHLRGQGCLLCSGKQQLTIDTFKAKAIAIHGDIYDYSKGAYTNNYTKIEIVCNIHGSFYQTPRGHLEGKGCKICGNEIGKHSIDGNRRDTTILTTEEFIEKAIEKHGDKYDYSRSVYIDMNTPIEIICSKHGSFYQLPRRHLLGRGCNIHNQCDSSLTLEEFIKRATEVHGDIYDYSNTSFSHNTRKVKIGCFIHGEFEQLASSHLSGHGCMLCGWKTSNTSEFIEQSRLVHGDIYDYSNAEYKGNTVKVKIGCSIHGEFEQIPKNHKRGGGCPKCVEHGCSYSLDYFKKNPEYKAIPGRVYVVKLFKGNETFIKIGMTKHSIRRRFAGNTVPYNLQVITELELPLYDAFRLEQRMLSHFGDRQYYPEEYFGGWTECIDYSDAIREEIIGKFDSYKANVIK